jgi:glycine cleavage system pyridoxal-binding protein P
MCEYQSAICRLAEMEVANASLYDAAPALFEAVVMAVRATRGSMYPNFGVTFFDPRIYLTERAIVVVMNKTITTEQRTPHVGPLMGDCRI